MDFQVILKYLAKPLCRIRIPLIYLVLFLFKCLLFEEVHVKFTAVCNMIFVFYQYQSFTVEVLAVGIKFVYWLVSYTKRE